MSYVVSVTGVLTITQYNKGPEAQSQAEETFGAQLMMVLGATVPCLCGLRANAPAANGCLGTGGCMSGHLGPMNCEL